MMLQTTTRRRKTRVELWFVSVLKRVSKNTLRIEPNLSSCSLMVPPVHYVKMEAIMEGKETNFTYNKDYHYFSEEKVINSKEKR